jgi:uracil-DNA glycosylase
MKYGKQFWVEQLGEGWAMQLRETLKSPYATKLMDFLNTEYAMQTIKPARENLFKPFKLCPWSSLKVVILGNEPHQWTDSSGLAYGDLYTTRFHSAQLTTVFDCIEKQHEDPFYLDFDFSLEHWAQQGVLLLNRSLSVRVGEPQSHKKPWGKFNSAVLNAINEYNPGTIFILWGKEAKFLAPHLKENHYILTFDSPGEYSDKGLDWNCPNFKEANDILNKLYGQTIKW